jgi:hypothetical protein
MITLQQTIGYAGDPATAPLSTLTLAFDFPVYAFTSVDSRTPSAARQGTGSVSTWSVSHALTDTGYRLTPGNGAVTGNDNTARDDAQGYYLAALRAGAVSDLAVPVTVRFSVPGGIELGDQALDALCLVKLPLQPASIAAAEVTRETEVPADYILLHRPAFEHLKTQVAGSLKVGDNLILALISTLTGFDGGAPSISPASSADIKHLLEGAKIEVTAAEVNRLVRLIRAASDALFDFKLTVPEMRTVAIGGTFTVLRSDGRPADAADLQKFEIVAEFGYGEENAPRRLLFRFGDDVTVTNSAAAFTLTARTVLLRNGMQDPVRILVKGLDGAVVWSEEHAAVDPALAKLAIRVQAQNAATLDSVPPNAEPDHSKKLRGQVLTFTKDCPLKGALVLIQAKTDGDTAWHIVGAGTTDGSGAFTIPYPYGAYTDARAVVSLAPDESAPITVHRDLAPATIADDVLYLLLKDPQCPEPKEGDDCGCGQTDVGSRLPDHADLIGSDAYSQDIGSSCVNLSKPNRTINEYAYSGIVRTSDPDVANYTLTRYEAGLEDIDVHLLASINSGAAGLAAATATALANATTIETNAPNVSTRQYLIAVNTALSHVNTIKAAVAVGAPPLALTELATLQTHIDSVIAVLDAYKSMTEANDLPLIDGGGAPVVEAAAAMRTQVVLAIDAVGVAVRYELTGGTLTRSRKPVTLDNPVLWQDAPEPLTATSRLNPMTGVIAHSALTGTKLSKFGSAILTSPGAPIGQPAATLAQAVSVATGHVLHYKAVVKADGYSLGDLIYSLPLAPGQKKEIVVFDSSHSLVGAEAQTLTQNERLAMGLVSERDITDQLAGSISESMRGSSTADTRGISAGFGTGGQGYGGTGAYGGSGSAVIGVAGGWAQAGSQAQQDSSRDVAQYFGEKLRESVMQNAEGYRRLNASVVTTVQEGQRYGVTSEVVANHNHCHALTMMYFEVLRHFAVFQELAFAEECVFIPLLLTRFTTENVGKWRDVLAPTLLPLPSDTYLQPHASAPNVGRQHPLVKAFDADQRIRTHYANVDFPAGAYDEERIQYIRGTARLRVNLPRPRTRFDRILSFPVVKQLDVGALATAGAKFAQDAASYSAKAALTAGIYTLFQAPPNPPNPEQFEVLAREAVFDRFMRLDANYQTVPPAQCMRIIDFTPKPIPVMGALSLIVGGPLTELDFFAENSDDKKQWELYSRILGYPSVAKMLDAHFKGNLISEWDTIFEQDIAPLIFEKILDAIRLDQFSTDFSSAGKYHGGERMMVLDLMGTTPKSRNQLPVLLNMSVSGASLQGLKNYVTLYLDSASIGYSTAHFNGALFDGPVRSDLLDGAALTIPENSEDKRNPRREDRYLAANLIEHLNSNLEHYNKVLWYHLDPDRRYMLLDGFSIQVYDSKGNALPGPGGLRSLASVVKNEMISVAGNALVMPVAPGYRVSGSFISVKPDGEKEPPTLLDHYQLLTPVPPYRVSVPSKGVFAEAVMGACNACEKIETERLQDWSRYPIGDEPPAVGTVNVPTPAVTDWQAAFKDFAAPIVNVQNAPAALTPGAGLAGLSQLLGQAGVFKDITGLDANQQNAIKTYLSNQENAKAFAEMAKEMAMQQHNTQNSGKIMDSIAQAKGSGDITKEEAGELTKEHLQQQVDGGQTKAKESDAATQAIRSIPPENLKSVETPGATVQAKPKPAAPKPRSVEVQLLANYSDGQPMAAQVTLVFGGDNKSLTFEQITTQGPIEGVAQGVVPFTPGHWTVGGQILILHVPANFLQSIPVTIAGLSTSIDIATYVDSTTDWRTVNGRVDIKPGMRTLDLQLTAELEKYTIKESIELEATAEAEAAAEAEAKLRPAVAKVINLGELGGKVSVSGKISGTVKRTLEYEVSYSRIKTLTVDQK